jgi:rare lipoprotein A (peptidoglycan hydrolase)
VWGARRRSASWLALWPRLAARWPALPIRRVGSWSWRILAVVALVVLVWHLRSAPPVQPGDRYLATAPAPEILRILRQDEREATVRKKRPPELMALQWQPTSQPSPEPSYPDATTVVQPPPPPLPRVVPALAMPHGAIVGLATWYGGADGFGPEDTMADGSQFNPSDPTIAASNQWPLGSWLTVCLGDRCIEVQVRDRGAFAHALDLSHAAFSQLAPPGTGVIMVTISRLR